MPVHATFARILLIFVACLSGALAAIPRASPLKGGTQLQEFSALAGCWKLDEENGSSTEYWLPPTNDQMLGMSQTTREGSTAGYEFMRISRSDTGEITFTASPSGQETTAFRLVSLVNGQAVFENREHDFPQFIVYHLPAGDELLASIEGEVDGEQRSIDFVKHRAACS